MNSLTVYTVNQDLRVKDSDLGGMLGYAAATRIRDLIKRNLHRLEEMGDLPKYTEADPMGGRPSETVYLNRDQALYITLKSETEKAFEVQMEIIRCYSQYLDGKLQMSSTSEIDLISSHLEALQDREREILVSLKSLRDEIQLDLDKLGAIRSQAQAAMDKVSLPPSPPMTAPVAVNQPRLAGPDNLNLPPMPGVTSLRRVN